MTSEQRPGGSGTQGTGCATVVLVPIALVIGFALGVMVWISSGSAFVGVLAFAAIPLLTVIILAQVTRRR
ncbi:hypothetical protein ACIP5Y_05045 [Nocardia sp. NPDC088792]|uniref:hypothetical protein n=1 Tax=Nocardia sp. NPDC088792 TaxID=3364332 RepID=UPI0038020020